MKKLFNKNNKLPISLTAVMVVIALVAVSAGAKAQTPGITGIDHVGMNVPDLQQAIIFFRDMFGFEAVTKLGPFPMDAAWKRNFRIHENSGEVTIVMLRAGNGANMELFEYKPSGGSKEQVYRDDISASHISVYTTDIQASKTYLESKGLKFLTDINPGAGDTEGEQWVYFETPWGATMELNSYPAGKGYEKHGPAVKLWNTASAVELTTDVITTDHLQSLINKQIDVWNNADATSRLSAMKEIYNDHVSFFDHDGTVNGLENLNHRITTLQQKFSDFRFSLIKVDNSNNVVRYYWNFGPASNPKLIAGMDLIVLEEGKIRSINVFLDHLPGSANR